MVIPRDIIFRDFTINQITHFSLALQSGSNRLVGKTLTFQWKFPLKHIMQNRK